MNLSNASLESAILFGIPVIIAISFIWCVYKKYRWIPTWLRYSPAWLVVLISILLAFLVMGILTLILTFF